MLAKIKKKEKEKVMVYLLFCLEQKITLQYGRFNELRNLKGNEVGIDYQEK